MSPPISLRDLIPPGFITLVVIYVLGLGFLAAIRYFDVVEVFFRKQFIDDVSIFAVIGGALYVLAYFIMSFHPEWWSKGDNIGADVATVDSGNSGDELPG